MTLTHCCFPIESLSHLRACVRDVCDGAQAWNKSAELVRRDGSVSQREDPRHDDAGRRVRRDGSNVLLASGSNVAKPPLRSHSDVKRLHRHRRTLFPKPLFFCSQCRARVNCIVHNLAQQSRTTPLWCIHSASSSTVASLSFFFARSTQANTYIVILVRPSAHTLTVDGTFCYAPHPTPPSGGRPGVVQQRAWKALPTADLFRPG